MCICTELLKVAPIADPGPSVDPLATLTSRVRASLGVKEDQVLLGPLWVLRVLPWDFLRGGGGGGGGV